MIRKVLKTFLIIFFVLLPISLIIWSMFFEFFGYILFVNKTNRSDISEIINYSNIKEDNLKIVILDNNSNKKDKLIFVDSNFGICIEEIEIENQITQYIKNQGLDIYQSMIKFNYIYVTIFAIVFFFKKLFENVDMFENLEERDN